MSEYYFIFIWLILIAYTSLYAPVQEKIMVLGKEEIRWKLFWAFLVFVPVIHLASIGDPRSDTSAYISAYVKSEASISSIIDLIRTHESGFAYKIFQDVVKIITNGNVVAFRVVLSLCHIVPVILVFRKYSTSYLFSAFLFIATGCHIGWMMNGIRQFLAVSIIFGGTTFIIRRKYVPAIILILIASTVHTSALVMVPVIFIVQGRAWNKKTLLYITIAVIAMLVFSRRIELVDTLLAGTEYEGTIANMMQYGDDGVNPLRVAVNAVPVILAYYGRKTIAQKNDSVVNMCVNMSVINFGIYIVAMVTSGIMIGRLPIYVSLYTFILLPYLIKEIYWGDLGVILKVGSLVGYMLYYFILYRGWV